jgi:L,D-transpeptidase YbiS
MNTISKKIFSEFAFKMRFKKALVLGLQFYRAQTIRFLVLAVVLSLPLLIRLTIWNLPASNHVFVDVNEERLLLAQQKITKEIASLDNKLLSKTPKTYFLVINSSSNEFILYKGDKMIKKDKCSTGSYILLKNGEQQQWMFKTPKGEFRIQGKTTSPVWKKPDWAFVEEGLPVPPINHYSRFEGGVLGDYALSLGQGYLIHGTLYQRFLGLPVTHGCIRLNDENLELVYRSLQVGSKVYIY